MREDPLRETERALSRITIEGGRTLLDLLYFADVRVKMDIEETEILAAILLNIDQASQVMQRRILEAMDLEKTDKEGAKMLMERLAKDLKTIREARS